MSAPHKHRDVIIAWANGEKVEYLLDAVNDIWQESENPCWFDKDTWRIKPKRVKKEGWVNVYKGNRVADLIYPQRTSANVWAQSGRVACIHIEWEEEL